jgi:transposase
MASLTPAAAVPRAIFPPEVAIHVGRLAGERPDALGRSLSPWECTALAHQLIAAGMVEAISAATVRRLLACPHLKPWRPHGWLSPKRPRDAVFDATLSALIDLYPRPRPDDEIVLSVDETTSRPPRPRLSPTRPAPPGNLPTRQEHAYKRSGALNWFAAVETRSGTVDGQCSPRQRQQECIAFLAPWDAAIDQPIKTIHLVCDHVSTHHGKEVRQWLEKPPRVVVHFTPVHCSWMNPVEPWFSSFQRQRLRIADVESKEHLQAKIAPCMCEGHQHAPPFNWSLKSVAKVMAKVPAMAA